MKIRNSHVLTVGPPLAGTPPASYRGYPVDFPTIKDAMDAVPWMDPEDNFVERWTILLTTGYYKEEIRCKRHVNIVGINKKSVYIQPPRRPRRSVKGRVPRLANVYLNSFSLLSNVTLLGASDAKIGGVAVWGFDKYRNQGGDVYNLGLSNVDLWPASPCKLIRMEGNWHTAIFREVGGTTMHLTGTESSSSATLTP